MKRSLLNSFIVVSMVLTGVPCLRADSVQDVKAEAQRLAANLREWTEKQTKKLKDKKLSPEDFSKKVSESCEALTDLISGNLPSDVSKEKLEQQLRRYIAKAKKQAAKRGEEWKMRVEAAIKDAEEYLESLKSKKDVPVKKVEENLSEPQQDDTRVRNGDQRED